MFCLKDLPLRPSATQYLVVVLLLITTVALGQVYPVQVTAQLTAPYSPYLSDYTTPGSQKLRLQLRLNDPTLSEYRCKLRITIEGVGITLKTKPSFIPQPIVVSGGGIPELLYGEDIAEYFDPNNLDFAGLGRGDYTKSAKLPEGVYRFSFEVLDYNRNTLVSNKGMATAWIILNDPPILNLPRNDTKIKLIDPTNIVFTWTSRHKSSPNAVLTTEYKFRLIEIWPLNRNPYDAVLTQPPLYEVTTDMEQLIYGPAEPMLIPGRKYAWQVQTVDQENRDLFKNQGRSEVFVFQYGDALLSPENLRLQTANQSNLTVRWDQTSGGALATTYRIQYREHRNRSSNEWYQLETTDQWKAISMLKADTEYEVQVRAEQFFQQSAYSEPKIFRTLPIGANEFVCRDDAPPPPLPSTATPLFNLMINDTIKAGGYDILVRKVQGGTGTYSGEGMAIIPYLNGAKVRVTFENIRVNEQNMLTAGVIKSYWNAESKFMLDTEKETPPSQIPNNGNIPVVIAATETLIEIKDAAIATITKDEDGNAIVHTTDGQAKKLEKGESYSVVDELGNGYVVDKDGNVTKTTATEAKAAHDRGNRNYNLVLRFEKGDGAYGFDDLPIREPGRYNALASHYQQVEGQYIAWKAVTSSQPDAVMVIPEDASMNLSDIRFEVNTSVLQPQNNGGAIKLSVQGKAAGMVEELIASTGSDEQAEVIGKLNLVSYDQLNKKVVIVPVNKAQLPSSLTSAALTEKLTTIFSQAVVSVQVKIDPKITVTLGEEFDDGESGMLSNYTGDMKKVTNAYGRLENETYYLFLVENPRSGNTALGYMPRSKQAGFIFVDNHGNDPERLVRTMAHELSHGMFNLKHTFSEYSSLSRVATQNLMDYTTTGTELLKYQWDYVHDPQTVIPLFEGDEEGESSWTIIDKKHTLLFNHVYDRHKLDNQYYANKLQIASTDAIDIEYDSDEEAEWVKSWKIITIRLDSIFTDELEAIASTPKGHKIPKVVLKPKHIYLGNYAHNGQIFPVAVYGNGSETEMKNAFTKVEVTEIDELKNDENQMHIYIEETYTKYFVVAFYEEGKKEPSMIMQIEKFVFAKSLEKWLRYLKILVDLPKEIEENDDEEPMENPGEARAQLARQKDLEDTRLYKTPVYIPEKLTDDYVDCSEFTNEITLSQNVDITYGSDEQLAWFKKNGQWGTSWEDVKVGDVIFWDRKFKRCSSEEEQANTCDCEKKSKKQWFKDISSPEDIDHVGIVVEFDETTKLGRVVHASVQGYTNPSINEVAAADNGNIYDGSCDQMTFIAWGRIEK